MMVIQHRSTSLLTHIGRVHDQQLKFQAPSSDTHRTDTPPRGPPASAHVLNLAANQLLVRMQESMNHLRAVVATLLLVAASACSDDWPSTAPNKDDATSTPSFDLAGSSGSAAPLRTRLFP